MVDFSGKLSYTSPMDTIAIGGGNSNIFYFSPLPGEMIQFDKHIFQVG